MCSYKGKNILAIDDYEDNLLLIQHIFESLGCNVTIACSGATGLTEVREALPHLIILDLMMPEMSGIEFMDCLRDNDWQDIPVLLLTANHNVAREDIKDANGICYKPIDINSLIEEAETLLFGKGHSK